MNDPYITFQDSEERKKKIRVTVPIQSDQSIDLVDIVNYLHSICFIKDQQIVELQHPNGEFSHEGIFPLSGHNFLTKAHQDTGIVIRASDSLPLGKTP